MLIFWLPFAACYYYCIYPHKESENNIYRKNSPNANGFKIIDGKTQKSYAHTFNVKCRKGRYRWKESKTKKKRLRKTIRLIFIRIVDVVYHFQNKGLCFIIQPRVFFLCVFLLFGCARYHVRRLLLERLLKTNIKIYNGAHIRLKHVSFRKWKCLNVNERNGKRAI